MMDQKGFQTSNYTYTHNLRLYYDIKDQRNIIVVTCVLYNFIRKHDRKDEGFNWDEHDLDRPKSNSSGEDSSRQANVKNIYDEEMKFVRDKIAWSICGL